MIGCGLVNVKKWEIGPYLLPELGLVGGDQHGAAFVTQHAEPQRQLEEAAEDQHRSGVTQHTQRIEVCQPRWMFCDDIADASLMGDGRQRRRTQGRAERGARAVRLNPLSQMLNWRKAIGRIRAGNALPP